MVWAWACRRARTNTRAARPFVECSAQERPLLGGRACALLHRQARAPKHDRTSYMPSRSKKAWGGGGVVGAKSQEDRVCREVY